MSILIVGLTGDSGTRITMQWKEPYVTEGINKKLAVVAPSGIYRGWKLKESATAMHVAIGEDSVAGDHVAMVRTSSGDAITIRRTGATLMLPLTAFLGPTVIALQASYSIGADTSVEIRGYSVADWGALEANTRAALVALGTVDVPSNGPILTDLITATRRNEAWESVAPGAVAWASLLQNGGFEWGSATSGASVGYLAVPWVASISAGNGDWQLNASDVASGKQCLQLVYGSTATSGAVAQVVNTPVGLGASIRLRFKIKVLRTATAGDLAARIKFSNGSGITSDHVVVIPLTAVDAAYRVVDAVFSVPVALTGAANISELRIEATNLIFSGAGPAFRLDDFALFLETEGALSAHPEYSRKGTVVATDLDFLSPPQGVTTAAAHLGWDPANIGATWQGQLALERLDRNGAALQPRLNVVGDVHVGGVINVTGGIAGPVHGTGLLPTGIGVRGDGAWGTLGTVPADANQGVLGVGAGGGIGVQGVGEAGGYGVKGTGGATGGGVYGKANGGAIGVEGVGGTGTGAGVSGTGGDGGGVGVSGQGVLTGDGVVGTGGSSASTAGVRGESGSGTDAAGVVGNSASGNHHGVYGSAQGAWAAIYGKNVSVADAIGPGVSGKGSGGAAITPAAARQGVIGVGGLNGVGVQAVGDGSGDGVLGTGGLTGYGVHGIGGTGGTGNVGVFGAGGPDTSSGTGVRGEGATNGVPGWGGDGVYGLGGGEAGRGVYGEGGSLGVGIYGKGGTTEGSGVEGYGTGGSSGVYGQGGATGFGVEGQGGSALAGVKGTGGAAGAGVVGQGGAAGAGIKGTGGAGDTNGVEGTCVGDAAGVWGNGGATGRGVEGVGVIGVSGTGDFGVRGFAREGGYGVSGYPDPVSAPTNSMGGLFQGKGTGIGLSAAGGDTGGINSPYNGAGLYGEGGAGAHGVVGSAVSGGYGGRFTGPGGVYATGTGYNSAHTAGLNTGTAVVGLAGTTNGHGGYFWGEGYGYGVYATGGSAVTGANGIYGKGGPNSGYGVLGVAIATDPTNAGVRGSGPAIGVVGAAPVGLKGIGTGGNEADVISGNIGVFGSGYHAGWFRPISGGYGVMIRAADGATGTYYPVTAAMKIDVQPNTGQTAINTNGYIVVGSQIPASTTGFANTITRSNIPKAWGLITITNNHLAEPETVSVTVAGFNIAGVELSPDGSTMMVVYASYVQANEHSVLLTGSRQFLGYHVVLTTETMDISGFYCRGLEYNTSMWNPINFRNSAAPGASITRTYSFASFAP